MKEKEPMTAAKKKQQKRKKQNLVRRVIQLLFFVFAPSLFSEAFAGVKGMFILVEQGEVIKLNDFLKCFFILAVLTILIGRYFCGYACAFGTLGDFIYGIKQFFQKKCKTKLPRIPENVCIHLQKLKYINLLFILGVCLLGKSSIMDGNSPWEVFSRMQVLDFNVTGCGLIGRISLLFIFVGMFFEERFFCQFLCPLGAIFSFLPILPIATLKRKEENCIKGCSACKKQCPVHHRPEGISMHSNECIQCGRCRLLCPKGNIGIRK